MPFYTFKCPKCKEEKEIMQGMNDKLPMCTKCKKTKMERIFKVITKPPSKGGKWEFKKNELHDSVQDHMDTEYRTSKPDFDELGSR